MIHYQLNRLTEICGVEKKDPQNPLRIVVKALLKDKGMNQKDLADYLETEDANLSQRLLRGSMTTKMLGQLNELFGVDVLNLASQVRSGVPIEKALIKKNSGNVEIDFHLSPEEVKEVMMNQNKTIAELQQKIDLLVGQIATWIEHDVQKAHRQDEIINTLMEERAEYKSKKK